MSLRLNKHHAMKAYVGRGGRVPCTLELGGRNVRLHAETVFAPEGGPQLPFGSEEKGAARAWLDALKKLV